MPSDLDRRAARNFSYRVAARSGLLFIAAAVVLFLLTRHLLYQALSGQWEVQAKSAQERWLAEHADASPEVLANARDAQEKLSAALRAQAEQRFRRTYLLLSLAFFVSLAAGGIVITYRQTATMRRILRTVDAILEVGDMDRRVSTEGARGTRAETVALINRLLDRNASLVRTIHDSLDNVAHDLKTPMTRLRATAERALQQPDDVAAAREALADCLEEADRVLTMLNTLMEVAEAETGAMRLDRKRVELDEVVRDVTDLYSVVAEERAATIATRVEAKVAAHADPTRLRQALANLVDNALKYGGKGNEVTVALARDGGDAVLTVADKGPGIPADDLPRIWERLYRGDRSRHERGLGLGLSFVRAIVEAHGGHAEVETELGKGSTFRIRIRAI